MQNLKIKLILGLTSLLLMPVLVFGQVGGIDVGSYNVGQEESLPDIIDNIIDWAFALLLILAAVFIIIAAYYYLAGAGSEESVKKAKNLIIYAVVAIVVAFLARTIVTVVIELLGASAPGTLPE